MPKGLRSDAPGLAEFLTQPWVDELTAAVFTIIALYAIGWAATQVFGRRLLGLFEGLIVRVPVIGFVYGAVRKLVALCAKSRKARSGSSSSIFRTRI